MVGQKLASLGKTHGVDAVWFEKLDGAVGDGAHDEQRQKQIVATGELRRQEDGHERGVHHTRHHARHSDKGEVFRAEHGLESHHVGHKGKQESCHTAHIQRRGESAAHTAGTVGGGSGECLG